MNTKDFETVIEEQIEKCKEVLIGKAKEYAQDDDRLHNFKNAAGMMGCDPKEALAGMMAKHTISVYDMCRDGRWHSLDLWNEKITDHINYLLLLKAIVMEEKTSVRYGRRFFNAKEVKTVEPGDKVEFDCGRTTANIDAIENEVNEYSKRIGELWSKNLGTKPLNSESEEKETEIDSRQQWAKKIAESLGVCSDPEGTCADCVIHQCPGRPDEQCSNVLMKRAKTIIEKYILDSEEKEEDKKLKEKNDKLAQKIIESIDICTNPETDCDGCYFSNGEGCISRRNNTTIDLLKYYGHGGEK